MHIESMLGITPRVAPGRIALDDGDRVVTYGDLTGHVLREAQFLRATGGLRFGLLADNGTGWILADLALHHLNRLNVPLPRYFTPSQLQHLTQDATLDTLLTDRVDELPEAFSAFHPAGQSPVSGLHVFRRSVREDARSSLAPGVVKVTYTSGSSGEPRGVCLTAATLNCVSRSLVEATASLGIRRHLCLMPLPTLLENIAGVHSVLRAGASCIVPPSDVTGMSYGSLDAQRMLATIARLQPESLVLVPELLRLLVQAAQRGYAPPRTLKFIAVGGAVVSGALLEEAAAVGLPVYEGYGLSECASVVCLNTPQHSRSGSVGRPLPHARVRVDSDGQILVTGAVMSGYLGDSITHGSLEIATGDLGEIDPDGYVYICGRLKNTFITSFGRNVSPEWVERELAHETVIRHALAYGEAQPAVAALLSPFLPETETATLDLAVQRANTRLPDYARVHHWVRMPEVPTFANGLLTANGRLRRDRVFDRFGALLRAAC